MSRDVPTLTDHQAIANLVHALAEAIDDADFDAVEARAAGMVFTLDDHPPVVGAPAFRQMLERGLMLHDGSPACQHVVTNLAVTVDAEAGTAEARSAVTVLQGLADFPLQVVLAGRYTDHFTRAPALGSVGALGPLGAAAGDPDPAPTATAAGSPPSDPYGGWRFASRHLRVVLRGDTSRHTNHQRV